MRDWRMSLRRIKSAIISWDGSFTPFLFPCITSILSRMTFLQQIYIYILHFLSFNHAKICSLLLALPIPLALHEQKAICMIKKKISRQQTGGESKEKYKSGNTCIWEKEDTHFSSAIKSIRTKKNQFSSQRASMSMLTNFIDSSSKQWTLGRK